MTEEYLPPVVMAFAGSDPTGGAGIQADIETLASMGCHCAPVITAVTIQDTQDLIRFGALDIGLITEQARAVLEDMPVSAFKIGMVGSAEAVEAIHSILIDYPDIPVVLDPVLATGAGTELADLDAQEALLSLLFPQATVVTPNSIEARRLAPEADSLDACAQELLETGCNYVLLTGTHENTEQVINQLYGNKRLLDTYTWARLPHSYHGSGCTLAAAIAGLLAHGVEPLTAIREAQDYTWNTLNLAHRLGMGQHIPNRFFWTQEEGADESDYGRA